MACQPGRIHARRVIAQHVALAEVLEDRPELPQERRRTEEERLGVERAARALRRLHEDAIAVGPAARRAGPDPVVRLATAARVIDEVQHRFGSASKLPEQRRGDDTAAITPVRQADDEMPPIGIGPMEKGHHERVLDRVRCRRRRRRTSRASCLPAPRARSRRPSRRS